MELIQLNSRLIFLAASAIAILFIFLISLKASKYFFTSKKGKSNKLLLKELLEELSLEVPVELEEATGEVIKTLKGS